MAEELCDHIDRLRQGGFEVISAISKRLVVPNNYGPTHKVDAPVYVFYADENDVELVSSALQSRPNGKTVKEWFCISGSVVPPGYRCTRRSKNDIEIRPI